MKYGCVSVCFFFNLFTKYFLQFPSWENNFSYFKKNIYEKHFPKEIFISGAIFSGRNNSETKKKLLVLC